MSEQTTAGYQIRSVADFLTVPEDKLDACLADFKTWLTIMGVTAVIREMTSGGVTPMTEVFTWIDDGKHDAHVTFHVQPDPKAERVGER